MQQIGPVISSYGIENHGIIGASIVRWNYTTPALYEHAIRANEAVLASGPLVVRTGDHTGRSPLDKFVVEEPSSQTRIWWGDVNVPFPRPKFEELHRRMRAYTQGRGLFVQDHGAHRPSPGWVSRRLRRGPAA